MYVGLLLVAELHAAPATSSPSSVSSAVSLEHPVSSYGLSKSVKTFLTWETRNATISMQNLNLNGFLKKYCMLIYPLPERLWTFIL